MATSAGIVAVNRFVFGEAPTPDGRETMQETFHATPASAAQSHLRKLCGGCHPGTRRGNRDDAVRDIGSGCAACHARPAPTPGRHPLMDAQVPDDACFGCHSRSGRISLSYRGLFEIAEPERRADEEAPDLVRSSCESPFRLPDGRTLCATTPDVHHARGLSCVDCHLQVELMGDGRADRIHSEQAVRVRCESCHGPASSEAILRDTDDPAALRRVRNRLVREDRVIRVASDGRPLWNVFRIAGAWFLESKNSRDLHPIRPTPTDATHALRGHERLACSACHSRWAPTCVTCHTRFDPAGLQWDFATGAVTPGAWVERHGPFGIAPPILAVLEPDRIVPAVPAMVGTLDASLANGPKTTLRFLAPLEPHTTSREARGCRSCHSSGWTLGLGTGTPPIRPETPPEAAEDRLAFASLSLEPRARTTRVGLRPFSRAELLRVLRVSLCLDCHREASDPIWRDFGASLSRMTSSRCPAPPPRW